MTRQQTRGSDQQRCIAIVTSIHPDFDSRIWKHASSLARSGYDVHLVCPWNPQKASPVDGVTFHPFKRVQRRIQRPFLVPWRVLGKLLPLFSRVDIIHFHDIDLLPWMAIIALRKPVVYDVHENYPDEMLVRQWIPRPLRWPLYFGVKWGQLLLSSLIRNVVLVVPEQRADFRFRWFRVLELRNFASRELVNDFSGDFEDRQPAVVFTGGHYRENGSLLILDIAACLRDKGHPVLFLLSDRFADDAFRSKMTEEIQRRALDDFIEFLPRVPSHKIMDILNKATIGIAPNLRVTKQIKAIPTKIFEYMAAGLAVVASDLPHAREIIAANDAGILADPDQPDSFVTAIQELVRDRPLAMRLGRQGRFAFEEKFCWEGQISRLICFYDEILEARGWRIRGR